jgi:proteic killer suppression protein
MFLNFPVIPMISRVAQVTVHREDARHACQPPDCLASREALQFRVIKSFADRHTQELYACGGSRRIPAEVGRRAARKLEYIDLATRLDDLRFPPGNRLHALAGDRIGQYAISVNDRWRICFRFVDGDAYDVEFCDYH